MIWIRLTRNDLLTAAMWVDRYCYAKDTDVELWLN
jgi:hypothetical protein